MNINMNMPSSSVGSSMNSYTSTVTADNTQGQDLLRLLNQQGMQQQQPQDKCIESMQQQQNQDMYVTMMHQQQRRMNFPSLINSSTISTTTNIHQPTPSGATSVEPSASTTTSSNNAMPNSISTSTSNASDINIHDIMALRSIEHTNELLVQKLESLRQGNVANPIDMQQHLNDKSNHPNTNDKSFSNITSTTSSQLPGKSEQPGSNSTSSPSKSPSR